MSNEELKKVIEDFKLQMAAIGKISAEGIHPPTHVPVLLTRRQELFFAGLMGFVMCLLLLNFLDKKIA
jgi:hypothetical protein